MIQLFYSSYKNVLFCSYALVFLILAVVKEQIVNYQGDEVHRLNELEYVYDEVWANVWMVWTCSPTTSSIEQLISYYSSQLYLSNMNLRKVLGRICVFL